MVVVRSNNLFVWAVIGAVASVYFIINGFKNWKLKLLIENIPTSKIRGIAMGLVEIQGSVGKPLKQFLKSPFTGNDCVYYKYTIEELRSSGKSRKWVVINSGIDSTNFFARDSTGSVLVEPKGATIEIPLDFEKKTSLLGSVPQMIQQFCAKKNIAINSFFGWNKSLCFKEAYLAPNDRVYILGTAGDNPFVEEATAQKGVEDIMIQKGNGPFYISDKGEMDVLKSFAWKVYLGVYGGSVLFLACIAYIFWALNLW